MRLPFAALLVIAAMPALAVDPARLDDLQQRKDANQIEIDYLQSELQVKELRAKTGRQKDEEVVLPLLTGITAAGNRREAEFRHRDGLLRVSEGDLLVPGWTVLRIGNGEVKLRRKGHGGAYTLRLGSPWPTRGG